MKDKSQDWMLWALWWLHYWMLVVLDPTWIMYNWKQFVLTFWWKCAWEANVKNGTFPDETYQLKLLSIWFKIFGGSFEKWRGSLKITRGEQWKKTRVMLGLLPSLTLRPQGFLVLAQGDNRLWWLGTGLPLKIMHCYAQDHRAVSGGSD